MTEFHDTVLRVLLVVFSLLTAGAVYSATFSDGSMQLPLQALVVIGAVILGIEPWFRTDRVRVSMAGGILLVASSAYGGYVIVSGRLPLRNPAIAGSFVVGALLVVVTQSQIRSSIRDTR